MPVDGRGPTLLAVPDKFRLTATAAQVANAICAGAAQRGWACIEMPMSDGGEGFLEAMASTTYRTSPLSSSPSFSSHILPSSPSNTNNSSTSPPPSANLLRQIYKVSGPLGQLVDAEILLENTGQKMTAVVESAQAAGLLLAGGITGNDPLRASTRGVGQLISHAVLSGAEEVVVGVGGTASTDGGLGAILALSCGRSIAKLKEGVSLVAAVDVEISFIEAAEKFATQKGASPRQVEALKERLKRIAELYRRRFGINVDEIPGSGAGGGLAGGLAAIGADIASGFDVVAGKVGFQEALRHVDLVVTGEGSIDERSFEGKLVGKVIEQAVSLGLAVLVVAGDIRLDTTRFPSLSSSEVKLVSLVQRFGYERAMQNTVYCIEQAIREQWT